MDDDQINAHKPKRQNAAAAQQPAQSRIIQGLEDALAFSQGDTTRGKLTTVMVPDLRKSIHHAVMMAVQLQDFGHDETDDDGEPCFATDAAQLDRLEAAVTKAADDVMEIIKDYVA